MKNISSHKYKEVYEWLGIDLDSLGCVMLDVEKIPNPDPKNSDKYLYTSQKKERFWMNGWVASETAHVTLLYGLLSKAYVIEDHVWQVLDNWWIDDVEIESVGYFDSNYKDDDDDKDYYCIVAHIKPTKALVEGHQRLQFLPHINTFAEYKPHITLAYIKKDEALRDKLLGKYNLLYAGEKLATTELNLGKREKE